MPPGSTQVWVLSPFLIGRTWGLPSRATVTPWRRNLGREVGGCCTIALCCYSCTMLCPIESALRPYVHENAETLNRPARRKAYVRYSPTGDIGQFNFQFLHNVSRIRGSVQNSMHWDSNRFDVKFNNSTELNITMRYRCESSTRLDYSKSNTFFNFVAANLQFRWGVGYFPPS